MQRAHTLALSFFLGVFTVVALGLAGRGEAVTPHQAVTARHDTREVGDDETADPMIYLPLVTNWYDPSYVSPFGITMYGNIDDAAVLQKMKDAGSKWVITTLHWSAIEPTQGDRNWSSFDTTARNVQEAGMKVFVLFTDNPSWAAALPGGPVNDINDLVNLASEMAERYDCDGTDDAPGSPCVHYWSFYAEPDNGDLGRAQNGKGYWGHNGAGYADMLSHVSPAIHNVSSRAQVLIGGIAYDWFEEDDGPFVRSFLSDTLNALNTSHGGAQNYIDAVAFHFYPTASWRWPTIREKAQEIQGIMTSHGVGDLPLICPEMGYWSSSKYGSSEQEQARRLVQMYVRGLSVDIHPLLWYKVFDAAEEGSDEDTGPDRTSGLLRVNGSYKPSYYAYQTLTRELAGARYSRELDGVEGYVFTMLDGREKTVLWSTVGTTNVTFSYVHLRLVYTEGAELDIQDGQTGDLDGSVNGQITLAIYKNYPFYVERK